MKNNLIRNLIVLSGLLAGLAVDAGAQTAASLTSVINTNLPNSGPTSITVANVRNPMLDIVSSISNSSILFVGRVSTSLPVTTTSYVSATRYYGNGSFLTGIGGSPAWSAITGVPAAVQAVSNSGFITSPTANNLFAGPSSGNLTAVGSNNVAFGINALTPLTTGSSNTALGYNALSGVSIGFANTAVGSGAAPSAIGTNSNNSAAFGYNALGSALTAYQSVALGSNALRLVPDVSNSACVGYQSCATVGGTGQVKVYNTAALGTQAGGNLANASGNTLLGYQAGVLLTTGGGNIVIGNGVTPSTVPTSSTANYLNIGNTIFGSTTLSDPNGGNAVVGINTTAPAGALDVSGLTVLRGVSATGTVSATRFAGDGSLLTGIAATSSPSWYAVQNIPAQVQQVSNSGGISLTNLAVSANVSTGTINGLPLLVSGTNLNGSFALGVNALTLNTGNTNIAIGISALASNTVGIRNTAIGYGANSQGLSAENLNSVSLGTYSTNLAINARGSTMLGTEAARYLGYISNSVFIGFQSGLSNVNGGPTAVQDVTCVGYFSCGTISTTTYNTAVGSRALNTVTLGGGNTALGYRTGSNITTGSNNLMLGVNAQAPAATSNNRINIANTIYGDNTVSGSATVGGAALVGINQVNPSTSLHVSGTTIPGICNTASVCGSPQLGAMCWSNAYQYYAGCNGLNSWRVPSGTSIVTVSASGL